MLPLHFAQVERWVRRQNPDPPLVESLLLCVQLRRLKSLFNLFK